MMRAYHQQFRLIAALCYLVLPPVLCFGAAGTAIEHLFRPWPANSFYDAMLLAVCFSVAITEAIGRCAMPHDQCAAARAAAAAAGVGQKADALTVFEVLLALLLGVLYCAAQAPAAGACWLAVAAALTILVIAASVSSTAVYEHSAENRLFLGVTTTLGLATTQQQVNGSSQPSLRWSWQLEKERTLLEWVFSGFLCLAAVLFMVFPVLQPWSGPPEKFVRWHPYSPAGELVWRGVFAAYAAMMFWTGLEDPLHKHLAFTTYLGLSGFLHATVMLLMNLWERAHGRANGNPEHLYGDVAGWYLVSAMSGTIVLLHRFTSWTTKKQH